MKAKIDLIVKRLPALFVGFLVVFISLRFLEHHMMNEVMTSVKAGNRAATVALLRDQQSRTLLIDAAMLLAVSLLGTGILLVVSRLKSERIKLKYSEKKYRDIFNLAPQPMWISSQHSGRILDVNQAAIVHYGYTREEFQALTVSEIFAESKRRDRTDRRLFIQTNVEHRKRNGDKILVNMISNRLEFNGMTTCLTLVNDITERASYIAAIERQNERLRDIAWMQSHLVRAPLSRILGLTNLMRHNRKEDELRELIGFMVTSANELDDVIRAIVTKSELAYGPAA